MTPPTFSVTCISKNGAKTLPRLAESLKEFLARGGEWVLCDTSSTDGTPDVARSLGATVYEAGERFMRTIDAELATKINQRFVVDGEKPIVEPGSRLFHFADARNYAAGLATNDWVFWVDDDEAFTVLNLDEIDKIIARPGLEHCEYDFVFAHAADGVTPALQFTQSKSYRRSRMFWTGAVHELVTPIPGVPPRVDDGPNRVYLDPAKVFRLEHWQDPGKAHRQEYCPGLGWDAWQKMEEQHDIAGSADRQAHYLAREMYWLGRPKSAIKLFEEHIAMKRWPAERAQSMTFVGDCWGQLGEPEKQVLSYARAFNLDSTRREPLIKLARFYTANNNMHAAAAYASAALAIPWHAYYANDVRMYRAEPYALRFHARGWIGDIAGAQEDLLQALKFEPYNPEFISRTKFYFEYDCSLAPEGWMRVPELLFLHDTAKKSKRILELGSWKGRSTHALCTGATKNGGIVWAVDHFGGSAEPGDLTHNADANEVYRIFLENTKQFTNLRVRRADGETAAKDFPDAYFDAIFIDAEHTREGVIGDVQRWRSKARRILCGHDFCPEWPNVQAGVREALGGEPDEIHDSIWLKYVEPPPPNPLLGYLTSCLQNNFPVSFVKLGDGEKLCMDGESGANCDGHRYTQELADKLKAAFKWFEPRARNKDRTVINVVPFEDQPMYNCLLARTDNDLDAVKAFWGAVRGSIKDKYFVGPARLKPAAAMLKAEFVEVPLVNAFEQYSSIRERLLWAAKPGAVFVFCSGMASKCWIKDVLEREATASCLDAGSAFDPLFVGRTRTEQLPMDLLLEHYAEWLA